MTSFLLIHKVYTTREYSVTISNKATDTWVLTNEVKVLGVQTSGHSS